MKKLLLTLSLLFMSAHADYEIIKSKSKSFSDENVTSMEIMYFGSLENYSKSVVEIQKNIAEKGTEGFLNGLSSGAESLAKGFTKAGVQSMGAGLGIGIVIGALDPFIMGFYADQTFVQVEKITLKDGSIAYSNRLFVGNKHPSYSDEEIKNLINK
ncbi:MAG: hypothetical protein M0P91_04630 [Sulfuricurvum sp.]|jgi:hypothetical protein|uniref:hypothetical protein n=1 Tax=Sulfuricurvum sp. TaxID=2025608 RepID=UPI0025FDFF9C|nr:hypothetical protein [Sulfuricurvum sp.]MCK9372461.1 hypothetical protein [Sulfuricurvum sp.]